MFVATCRSMASFRRSTHSSDVFLHVSWTEGVPQVLFEAFAAGLPVVATDVGGVAQAVDGAALLVAPGDALAAAKRAASASPRMSPCAAASSGRGWSESVNIRSRRRHDGLRCSWRDADRVRGG